MAIYDGVMAVVIVGGMIWGALRGITWQLASILSLVLGYAVAFPMSHELAPHFPGQPIVARTLALLALYVGVSAAVFGVAWSIRATLRRWKFEAYDRHLGMILGGMEGALLGVVVTVFVVSLAPQTRAPILTSFSGTIVDRGLKAAKPALPDEVCAMLEPFWEGLDDGEPSAPTFDRAFAEAPPSEPIPAPRPAADGPKVDTGFLRSAFERGGAEAGRAFAEQFKTPWEARSSNLDDRTPRR